MKFLTSIFEMITKATFRAALVIVVMFADSFFIRAQESAERIYYRFDNATVDAAYLSNTEAFNAIDAALSNGRSEGIEIVSFSSPEGNFNYNLDLSTRRAKALAKYLAARYPQLAGKISINPNAESWEALRRSVESDTRLSESAKSQMLQIIDSNDSADVKEKKLGALQSWKYLYSNYFRTLRFAEVRFAAAAADAAATSSDAAAEAGAAAAAAITRRDSDLIFSLRSADIETGAHNNAAVLATIAGMISGRNADEIANINIVSTASPEGPESLNNNYSLKRGQALRDYIVSEYPELAGKITVHSAGEAWEDLRVAVESDATLSEASRSKLLSIIVSTASPDAKEAKLRALPEWKHLFEEVFPGLRYARVSVDYNEAPAEPAVPVAEPAEITVDNDTLVVKDSLKFDEGPVSLPGIAPKDTTKAETPATTETPATAETPATEEVKQITELVRIPALAVSTNLLFDAVTALNVSVAVPLGNHFSLRAEYINPWWVWDHNRRAFEIQHLGFGARYYPTGSFLGLNFGDRDKRALTGWYLEGMFGTGKYDIEPFEKGWQGEEKTLQLGGGYSFRFSDHWSLDLGAGFGYMQTHYRYYEGNADNSKLIYKYSGRYTWLGPTNVRASLTYLFYVKKKVKKEVSYE